jgi:hypothetical protein
VKKNAEIIMVKEKTKEAFMEIEIEKQKEISQLMLNFKDQEHQMQT